MFDIFASTAMPDYGRLRSDEDFFEELGLRHAVCVEGARNIAADDEISQAVLTGGATPLAPNTGFEINHAAGLGVIALSLVILATAIVFRKK